MALQPPIESLATFFIINLIHPWLRDANKVHEENVSLAMKHRSSPIISHIVLKNSHYRPLKPMELPFFIAMRVRKIPSSVMSPSSLSLSTRNFFFKE
jgi:hypothetical protein